MLSEPRPLWRREDGSAPPPNLRNKVEIVPGWLSARTDPSDRRALAALFGGGRQGYGEPEVAQGEKRHVTPRTTSSETAVALRGTPAAAARYLLFRRWNQSPTVLLVFLNNGGTS